MNFVDPNMYLSSQKFLMAFLVISSLEHASPGNAIKVHNSLPVIRPSEAGEWNSGNTMDVYDDRKYFRSTKYWGDVNMGCPPTSNFGGTVPRCPPISIRPCSGTCSQKTKF